MRCTSIRLTAIWQPETRGRFHLPHCPIPGVHFYPHLHRERHGVYAALARTVLGSIARPVILVDWADSALEHKQLILKATVPVKGRAISIYEEVHPMRRYNSPKTHGRFL